MQELLNAINARLIPDAPRVTEETVTQWVMGQLDQQVQLINSNSALVGRLRAVMSAAAGV